VNNHSKRPLWLPGTPTGNVVESASLKVRSNVRDTRCIKGLFARCLQVIESSGPNSRIFHRIKHCVLVQSSTGGAGYKGLRSDEL
jgi:hypothetical protein